MMTASGEYQRLEPGPEARGPAVDGTQATLMRLRATAALAAMGTRLSRNCRYTEGRLDFTHPGKRLRGCCCFGEKQP